MKKLFTVFVLILLVGTCGLFASPQTEIQMENIDIQTEVNQNSQLYGAMAVEKLTNFTLEEMLKYSIEDERMALAEYEMIMNKFNITKPFSNIIEAEKTHEGLLLELYKKYNFVVPSFDGREHLIIPENT